MPVRLRGTKIDLDAIRLCSFCSYLQKLSRRSLLRAIVSSRRLQYLGDAENGYCATWNRGEKREQLNERLECLSSGLISHEPLDYGRIYRIVRKEICFHEKAAATKRAALLRYFRRYTAGSRRNCALVNDLPRAAVVTHEVSVSFDKFFSSSTFQEKNEETEKYL